MAGLGGDALQKALYEQLTEDTALMALVSDVYDRPLEEAVFPYVTLGDSVVADVSNLAISGSEHQLSVHVWSREGGKKQAAIIMNAVYQALHEVALDVEGYEMLAIRCTSSSLLLEHDGITYHGTLRFRALLRPGV